MGSLESLSSELEPLGLKVSWVKTKIQVFNDSLGVAGECVPVVVRVLNWSIGSLVSAVISASLRVSAMKLINGLVGLVE